jgi:DNA-binding response OmpR family regulator
MSGRVVLADDSSVNRMLLAGILEQAGYDVRAATNGAEAVELVESVSPDIVLLDVQMPGMSGFEACSILKSRPYVHAIPVVFISALEEVNEKLKGFEVGGVDYVTKPFEPAEVLARVSTQVKLFRTQRELKQRNAELLRRNEQLARAHERTEQIFAALSMALTGSVIDGTYRLDEKIGEGGFGAVFRGMHLPLQRSVAIKVLRPNPSLGVTEQIERFRAEGIVACRVAHRNAVEVLDFGVSTEGIAYLVMELLHGRSVGSVLRDTRTLPIARASSIGAAVCDALGAAHAAGIVHRDIKPDNVFLHDNGDGEIVKVVDFGIAKLLDAGPEAVAEATQLGTLIGTPSYMAPERLLGRNYDERSDVYSVGVLVYLMLTGALPFEGAGAPSIGEMVKLHLTSKPLPLRDRNAAVPPALADIVERAIDTEPAQRPRVSELSAALHAFG